MSRAPLNDPTYVPAHPPVDGRVPDVVAKWGQRSQLRWFRRFRSDLAPSGDLSRYFCQSEHHRGPCCSSCESEAEDGFGIWVDGWCCCRDERA